MVRQGSVVCPDCGGELKYYDKVSRVMITKNRQMQKMKLRRLRCKRCNKLHREIPVHIFPFKEYEAEIIIGVLDELITCETLGYEDYPCELTMKIWKSQKKQLVLWRNLYSKGEQDYETCTG